MIEIEKGVEMPSKGAKEFIGLMKQMNFGDSFFVSDREITPKLRSNIYAASKAVGIAIKQKMFGNNLRVWRITKNRNESTTSRPLSTDECAIAINSIDEPVIAININQSFRNGISAIDLYDYTRGIWRLSKERAERAEYAFSVYQGIVKEVYEIDGWFQAGFREYQQRRFNPDDFKARFEFTGSVADGITRDKYIGKLLPEKHSQNPIRYYNC